MGPVREYPKVRRKKGLDPEGNDGERVYLGLGSNLGDREGNLRHALELLGRSIALECISSIYDSEPWGYSEQPRFLNCACEGRTSLGPRALLAAVKDVERSVGREPSFSNGPRLADVDILFYGQHVISEPGLEVPHPRLAERAFVLLPLQEIAPGFLHPVMNLTVAELVQTAANNSGGVSSFSSQGVRLWASPIPVPKLS